MHAHRIQTNKYKIEYHWNLSKLEKTNDTSTTNSQTLVYHSQFHRFSNDIGQQTNDNRLLKRLLHGSVTATDDSTGLGQTGSGCLPFKMDHVGSIPLANRIS